MSDSCTVTLKYSLEMPPIVRVENPVLMERDDEALPHIYPDGSLCLYYPSAGEFSRDRYLASTIVPWTSEWLLHYELWYVTGDWLGGGIHPGESRPVRYDEL
ncbi:MAG: hypothetical protein K9M08_09895 [Pirellula sp.]|nr:hypothetical protein [Pirellula sp.]